MQLPGSQACLGPGSQLDILLSYYCITFTIHELALRRTLCRTPNVGWTFT